MRIYALTPTGKRLARSVTNPDSSAYKIVAHLDQRGQDTTEGIAGFCGITISEAAAILRKLKRNKVVVEVSGSSL